MRKRLIFLCFILLCSLRIVSAQYYETGQDPSSLRWNQIKTGRFTVIYPENFDNLGIQYAKALDEAYSNLGLLFPEKKFKIPVVIHPYTTQSNGYVAWAPKRMELYPTPEQNSIPLAPEIQLATHEMTHVIQMESLNRGFSKWMTVLFGEQFTGIMSAFLPIWLLEGNAVFAETALTQSGRGRSAAFQKQIKAILTDSKKEIRYDKILNGSYRNFVPDNYQSGYQMVTWALAKNNPEVWNDVYNYTARKPFTLNPVNFSLRKTTGLTKRKLWDETADSLKNLWKRDLPVNSYKAVNPGKKRDYINYYSPLSISSDSIVAIKTSLYAPPSFVVVDPRLKSEKRLHTPGQMYPWFISYGKGRLVWVEFESDPRWENREYSVIKMMDLNTRKVQKISQKSRYLAASVSPDGSTIAAVESTVSNNNNLVVINCTTGQIAKTIQAPENVNLQHPQWSADGSELTFIYLAGGGEGIISFKPSTGQWTILMEPGRDNLQSSFLRNDSLFFVSSSSGTDNIYLKTPDNKFTAVTNSRFGAVDASHGGKMIWFANYTVRGNEICAIPADLSGSKIQDISSSAFLINRIAVDKGKNQNSSAGVYTPEPYRKIKHLLRFHSWMPFYADIDEIQSDPTTIRPGLTILTQNSLSTLTSTIGYEYSEDKRHVIHSKIVWKGWYPVFESQVDFGTEPVIYKSGENVSNPGDVRSGLSILNTVSQPLYFSRGKFSRFVRPSISAEYLNNYVYLLGNEAYDYGQAIFTSRLYLSNYHRSALRDIYPRWAQVADFNYRVAPFDKPVYGTSVALKTAFYFPGFLRNNGIKIRAEAERQQASMFLYGNSVSMPRSYKNIISEDINFLSGDYAMPLAYPDFNISSLLYIKRIRTNLFYDYAGGPGNKFYQFGPDGWVPLYNTADRVSFHSFGFELLADFFVMRIPYMISGGIQSAWKNTSEAPTIELLFNIDLYGFTLGKKRMR